MSGAAPKGVHCQQLLLTRGTYAGQTRSFEVMTALCPACPVFSAPPALPCPALPRRLKPDYVKHVELDCLIIGAWCAAQHLQTAEQTHRPVCTLRFPAVVWQNKC